MRYTLIALRYECALTPKGSKAQGAACQGKHDARMALIWPPPGPQDHGFSRWDI